MIATDKILSEEGFELNVGNVLRGSPEYKLKGMARLRESHRQLTALCREHQRWIRSANGSLRDDSQAPGYSELIAGGESLLAAFPETLKENTA